MPCVKCERVLLFLVGGAVAAADDDYCFECLSNLATMFVI